MGKNNCHKKWKSDGRFVRYKLRKDIDGQEFIPFCLHPGHIGLINDDRYRERKCEGNGRGRYCTHYRRFRDEQKFGQISEHLEVSVEYAHSPSASSESSQSS